MVAGAAGPGSHSRLLPILATARRQEEPSPPSFLRRTLSKRLARLQAPRSPRTSGRVAARVAATLRKCFKLGISPEWSDSVMESGFMPDFTVISCEDCTAAEQQTRPDSAYFSLDLTTDSEGEEETTPVAAVSPAATPAPALTASLPRRGQEEPRKAVRLVLPPQSREVPRPQPAPASFPTKPTWPAMASLEARQQLLNTFPASRFAIECVFSADCRVVLQAASPGGVARLLVQLHSLLFSPALPGLPVVTLVLITTAAFLHTLLTSLHRLGLCIELEHSTPLQLDGSSEKNSSILATNIGDPERVVRVIRDIQTELVQIWTSLLL